MWSLMTLKAPPFTEAAQPVATGVRRSPSSPRAVPPAPSSEGQRRGQGSERGPRDPLQIGR